CCPLASSGTSDPPLVAALPSLRPGSATYTGGHPRLCAGGPASEWVSASAAPFTRWRVNGTADEVFDVLADPLALKRWWPSVYIDVKELKPGDPQTNVGRVIDLYTKGWLPYTLRWNFTVTESSRPSGFKLAAHGDFEGTGVWQIT